MDKALITLTFDDGLRCQFERAVPILDHYGFPATFFLVANTDPTHTDGGTHPEWRKINWSKEDIQLLKGMVRRGHEIGTHGVTHRRPEVEHDPKFEAEKSKEWIESRLGVEVTSYCYPFCLVTRRIKKAAINAKYKQARGGAEGAYYPLQSLDLFNVDCRHVYRAGPENVVEWIRHPGCWHVLMFHGIGTNDDGWWPISVDEFSREMAELAKYRDSGKVEVVTFKEAADRFRQMK